MRKVEALTVWALAPLALTALAMRLLVPGRGEVGPGWWGGLARLGEEHPLALAVGIFVALSGAAWSLSPAGTWNWSVGPGVTRSGRASTWSWLLTVASAVVAALGLRAGVGQVARVTSGSMLPTLEPADDLVVNKLARWSAVRRGDLVVFPGAAVGEAEEQVVKRVIGLPGDRVATNGGLVSINGWPVPFCDAGRTFFTAQGKVVVGRLVVEWLEDRVYLTLHTPEATHFEGGPVLAGELFVLGDNRNASRDSREFRVALGRASIAGKVWRVVGWDRDGHLDWSRLLRTPGGTRLHVPGVEVGAAEARIARCLQNAPRVTSPPP
jgi:signal peptidase I